MSDFSIDYFSEITFDFVTVEISYKGQILCRLNKERGPDSVEVDFACEQRVLADNEPLRFPLAEFLEVLSEAKQALLAA